MKILYIANARLPTEKAHGLQIIKSCEAFAKLGNQIELLAPFRFNPIKQNPFDYYGAEKIFKFRRLPSLDLFILPLFPRKLAFYIQSLSFLFFVFFYLLFLNKKDLIFYSRDYSVLLLLSLMNLRPVAEIHDYRSRNPKSAICFIIKRASRIILNSEGTLAALRQHYDFGKTPTLVAPNGVDINFFDIKETKNEARRILDIPADKLIIGYVGRLETVGKEKGVATLINAFRKLPDDGEAMLYIVGGPDYLVSKYKNQYSDVRNVVFTGQVEYKKIPLYLRAIDAVVIPMPDDQHAKTTSPVKLFEFLAAGKVIIASDLPSLRNYLDENNAVFFKAENTDDLKDKLVYFLNHPAEAKKLADKARESAVKYTWTSRAEKILNFIAPAGITEGICYFGDYDPEYARNRVIIKGLKENGVEVIECNDRARGVKKYLNLFKKFKSIKGKFNFVIVGYSDSRFPLILAKLLTRKPVIWDAFYSIYDSYVFDRKLVKPKSLKAKYYWFMDWLNCKLADKILLDTNAHIDYFVKTFRIDRMKFVRVFIGADDGIFKPSLP